MKSITYIVSIVVAIAAIGCQKNDLAGPIGADQSSVMNKIAPSSAVDFNQIVKFQDAILKATGQAIYSISLSPILNADEDLNTGGYTVKIDLKGTLASQTGILEASKDGLSESNLWTVDGSSTESIVIGEKSSVNIDRTYMIVGMDSDVPNYLHVGFSVSRTQVSIVGMWIVNG